MNKSRINKRMSKLLTDTKEYYEQDCTRRGLDDTLHCQYITPDGHKCSIGRLLPQWALNLIATKEWSELSVDCLLDELSPRVPKALSGIPIHFLTDLQSFHDDQCNWNKLKGVTIQGDSQYNSLLRDISEGEYFL